MYVAGIDAHTRYSVVVVVNKVGALVLGPMRVAADQPQELLRQLEPYRPLEVVVETSSSWPWLRDLAHAEGIGFAPAHAKRLRAIADVRVRRPAIRRRPDPADVTSRRAGA